MSAGLLRRAAAKIRENADGATPGPWYDGPHGARKDCRCVKTRAAGRGRDYGEFVAMYVTRDASHIASWHPDVALAAVELLDVIEKDVGTSSLAYKAAERFARAYLGEA